VRRRSCPYPAVLPSNRQISRTTQAGQSGLRALQT
jgi:hypothetical protein